jgi:hypothetical protein
MVKLDAQYINHKLTHDDVNYLQLIAAIASNYTITKSAAVSAGLIGILAFVNPAQ